MTRRNRLIIAGVLLIPILVYAYAGQYSRLMADDFCYAVGTRTYGFPGVIGYYYDNWSGRLTQTLGAALGISFGVGFAEIFPLILLAIWLIGLLWACWELGELLALEALDSIYILAALILYATLAGAPQIFHSLYWISAVFSYTVPLVLVTFVTALVLRSFRLNHTSLLAILVCIVLTLIAVLASEPFAVAFAGALVISIVGVRVIRPMAQRALLILLSASLITTLVGLAIMVGSPGNAIRAEQFISTHDVIPLIVNSAVYAATTLNLLISFSPTTLVLVLVLPAIIAYGQPITEITNQRLRIYIALTAIIACLLIVLTLVPAIYATSTTLPARALIIPQFVLVCAYVVMGWLAGLYIHRIWLNPSRMLISIVVVALLIAGPLLIVQQMMSLTPTLDAYADDWDQRDAQIRTQAGAGKQSITVAPLSVDIATLTGLDTIDADPSSSVNTCAAEYYGVKSLTATG